MLEQLVLKVLSEGILMVLLLSAGPILVALVLGLLISLFQALTQIQEQTLSMVPKILGVFLTLALMGPWLIAQAVKFADAVFNLIPTLFR